MNQDFSIVICTHNPQPEIFRRLLSAISSFDAVHSPSFEVIIVDSNSTHAVGEMEEVKKLAGSVPSLKILPEKVAGLTNARKTGIKSAQNEWIVFLHDDNLPDPGYLQEASRLIRQYPHTGCWGPGDITVEYTGSAPGKWVQDRKWIFQERHDPAILTDRSDLWQPCYPYGTGMVVRKDILQEYIHRLENGRYSLTDRKGKSLSSGGDTQIILTGIQMGYAAGVSPSLALRHLIHSDKSNFGYMLRLIYGTASCYIPAHNQVFAENPVKHQTLRNGIILRRIVGLVKMNAGKIPLKDLLVKIAQMMGETRAVYDDRKQDLPLTLRWFQSLIKYK